MADQNRKFWNQQFKILQDTWPKPVDFDKCIGICLTVHAMVHSREVSDEGPCSFEDEMWEELTEDGFRKYYPGNQSIAWKMWHSARIEDMTMNGLIAGGAQIFAKGGWYDKLGAEARDTGNAMNEEEIIRLSSRIDKTALREYRNEVGRKTREIIRALNPEDLKKKVEPVRIDLLLRDGDVVEQAIGIAEYWGRKTYSGLLLMPATRHILVHLNESMRLIGNR